MNKRSWRLLAWLFLIVVLMLVPVAALVVDTAGAALPAGVPITSSSAAQAESPQQVGSQKAPFDCSRISALGIDKQMNMHAAQIMARCGKDPATSAKPPSSPLEAAVDKLVAPFVYDGADADVILPDGTYPHVTQSEAMSWAHGSTVIVNYNDSRSAPSC